MTNLTQKLSKQFFGVGVRVVTLALFLVVFTAGTALAQIKAYVSNANDSFISVIDTSTQTVVSNIPMGGFPDGLAVTPDGKFIYVLSRVTGEVLVISTATETIVDTVPVGGSEGPITISPNGALAYYRDSSGTISVISTATNQVTATIPLAAITPVAFTPNSAFAYVGTFFGDLIIIDTATNQVSATVNYGTGLPFGDTAFGAAVTPDGALAYVTVGSVFPITSFHISILSTATNMEVGTIPNVVVNDFTPDGAFGYGVNIIDSTVTKLDTTTNTVVATVPVTNAGQVFVSPDGTLVYSPNFPGDTVTAISVATNSVVATIPVGILPVYIGFAVVDPLQSLIAQIQALVDAGTLTQNQGAGLINKINQVIAKLDQNQTGAACNQLSAFISQVNAFITNHSLTPSQGQPLIDGANAIRASNGCA
jgi:YVTN family beta-propeller protein